MIGEAIWRLAIDRSGLGRVEFDHGLRLDLLDRARDGTNGPPASEICEGWRQLPGEVGGIDGPARVAGRQLFIGQSRKGDFCRAITASPAPANKLFDLAIDSV